MNGTGALVIRATRVGADTLLSQIVEMVAKAQRSRAPIHRYPDHVAGLFVPAVMAIAALAFVPWAVRGPEPSLSYGLVAAVSVLIISLPLRPGLGNADVDHDRHRARRAISRRSRAKA